MVRVGVVAVADVSRLFCTLSLPVGACTPKPMLMLPRLAWRGFQSQPCATTAMSPSPEECVVEKALLERRLANRIGTVSVTLIRDVAW